ncbi:LysR family transcriptional regulator [Gluconacetobacter sp. Hr-1-5]|uniref:LysR family transcriptional regulator n=1 Tax=Gluconacetobacter sp. Hr-1-5 TaxID=3395370 RepID=UPI003B51E203
MRRPPFDLWQLLCVRAIAEHGSIHGAARFLNIRQSAVSRSLHNLEERLDVRLFIRSPVGAAPTAFGQEFIRWSQTILDNVAGMNTRARRTGKGENGQISIGIQTCVLPGRLSTFTADFRATHPDIVFRYSEGTGKRLLRRLQRGQIDFAVVTRRNLAPALRVTPLWSDRIVAALLPVAVVISARLRPRRVAERGAGCLRGRMGSRAGSSHRRKRVVSPLVPNNRYQRRVFHDHNHHPAPCVPWCGVRRLPDRSFARGA